MSTTGNHVKVATFVLVTPAPQTGEHAGQTFRNCFGDGTARASFPAAARTHSAASREKCDQVGQRPGLRTKCCRVLCPLLRIHTQPEGQGRLGYCILRRTLPHRTQGESYGAPESGAIGRTAKGQREVHVAGSVRQEIAIRFGV